MPTQRHAAYQGHEYMIIIKCIIMPQTIVTVTINIYQLRKWQCGISVTECCSGLSTACMLHHWRTSCNMILSERRQKHETCYWFNYTECLEGQIYRLRKQMTLLQNGSSDWHAPVNYKTGVLRCFHEFVSLLRPLIYVLEIEWMLVKCRSYPIKIV